MNQSVGSYHGDHAAGPDDVAHAQCGHDVSVFTPPEEALVAHVVGALKDNKATPLNPAGVAPAQVGGQVRAITLALIRAPLEVLVLVEDDLWDRWHMCSKLFRAEAKKWKKC